MRTLCFALLLLIGFSSCKKFLEERSQTDMTPKTTKDYSELLFGDGYPLAATLLNSQLLFMDDDVQAYNTPKVEFNQTMVHGNMPAFTWQPDFIEKVKDNKSPDGVAFNSWINYYKLILGCNVALQAVKSSIGTDKEKRLLTGEALGLRAYYYFMLVNLYGRPYNDSTTTPDKSLGVPLQLVASFNEEYPVRNTVKEVYEQINSDLDSACSLLDVDKVDRSIYRFNYKTAHFLASRVALFTESWDKAVLHAGIALQHHPALIDFTTVMLDEDHQNVLDDRHEEDIWKFSSPAERLPSGYTSCYGISASLAQSYEEGDLRNSYYFVVVPPFMWPMLQVDYGQLKFNYTITDVGVRGVTWRSAELYLNRAEANIQLFKKTGNGDAAQQALNDLNYLRQHRFDSWAFQPLEMASADMMLQWCRDERRREFFSEEGHRWFDLRRYGMPAITHVFKPTQTTAEVYHLAARDPQYTLPIPADVIQRNPALQQNAQIGVKRLPQ
jgi:hypothetical protein